MSSDIKEKVPQTELALRRVFVDRLCPRHDIEARDIGDGKVEYKIPHPDVINFLIETYKMPRGVAESIVCEMYKNGLVNFYRSTKCSEWYYITIRTDRRSLSKDKGEEDKTKKFPNMKKLREQLMAWREEGKKIGLLHATYYCRLLSRAMQDDWRFKVITQKCKDAGFSKDGSVLIETVLEHSCLDTPFLGALMMAEEKIHGTDLDYELLHLVMQIHDWPEGLEGDTDFSLKTHKHDEIEESAFDLLVSVLDDNAKDYFMRAYAVTEEAGSAKRGGRKYKDVSLNAQFFCAVEVLGYLSRALYEVVAGNLYFVAVLFDHREEIEFFYSIFPSVRKMIDEDAELIERLKKEYENTPYRRQDKP